MLASIESYTNRLRGQGEHINYEHMPEKRTGQKLWSLL